MTKRSTVVDVARAAAVSPSTVSRHLRGVPVSAEVASAIDEAIRQLEYTPDLTARALRGGRTKTLGVVIPQVNNTFYAQAVQLMEEEARKRGYAVILLTHQEDLQQQTLHLATLRRYHTDGLIVAPAAGSQLEDIRSIIPGMPVVALDRLISPEMDSVVLRNHEAARTATEHLLEHGYRHIACVASRLEIASFQQRWQGYREAITTHQRPALLIEAPHHQQLRDLLCSALGGPGRPDALLTFSNRATLTVLQAYEVLSLPRAAHLPLLGFDDFDMAPMVDPTISVVRQPTEAMVRHALDILFERILERHEGNSTLAVQNIALPAQMVYRRSCGCP